MAYLKQAPTARIADAAVTGAKIASDVALAGNPTTTTQAQGNNTTRLATTAYVQTEAGLLIPKSIIDAKGDILVGTADNVITNLAAGANGEIIVYDSANSTGLEQRNIAPFNLGNCVLQAQGNFPAATSATTRAIPVTGTVQVPATNMDAVPVMDLDSDYTITNWTTKFRMRGHVLVNATAPGQSLTLTLRTVSTFAGAAGILTGVTGAADANYTVTIASATLTAGATADFDSGWQAAPTSGLYMLCAALGGTSAASSYVTVTSQLFVRFE